MKTASCYSEILQKSGLQNITCFSEEKPGLQKAYGKYGLCTAFIRVLYGFCTGFRKQNQVLQPKTWFSTSSRCKAWFLLPTPLFCRFFEYQVGMQGCKGIVFGMVSSAAKGKSQSMMLSENGNFGCAPTRHPSKCAGLMSILRPEKGAL